MQKLRTCHAHAGEQEKMSAAYKPKEKWDVHTHTVFSPETYESLSRYTHYDDFIRVRAHETKPCCAVMVNSKGEVQREVEEDAYNADVRLKDCDDDGVTFQILSPTPMMIPDYVDNVHDAVEICQILNDDNAKTASHYPKRFGAIGAIPMQFPDKAIKEMERIKKTLGMRGIEINSNINGMDLDDKKLFPIFAAAVELDMAVFIHPWGGFMSPTEERLKKRMNPDRNWRPWLVGMGVETALAFDSMRCGGVHEVLPKLRVMYAHGGGAFPALLGRLDHGPYCRPDLFEKTSQLDPFKTLKECGVYVDSLVHAPHVLNMLIGLMGVERIALGSDYPYPLGERNYPGCMIEHLPVLTDQQRDRMLAGTAKEWLGYR
jgi:aminocarboxymuconate-semialdehyde decarboxylase